MMINMTQAAAKLGIELEGVQLLRDRGFLTVNSKRQIDEAELSKITPAMLENNRLVTYSYIQERFNCSKDQAKSLWLSSVIKEFKMQWFKYGDYPLFLEQDIVDQDAEIRKHVKPLPTPKARRLPVTLSTVADALYVLNKSAKLSRDTKNIYGRNEIGNRSRTRMRDLYFIKDCVLNRLLKDGTAMIVGLHTQGYEWEDDDGCIWEDTNYLTLIECNGLTFHRPATDAEVKKLKVMGAIPIIPATGVRKDIKLGEAVSVLSRFLLGEDADETSLYSLAWCLWKDIEVKKNEIVADNHPEHTRVGC